MSDRGKSTSAISRFGDLPVCPGCGFVSHITHGDICGECFQRRNWWQGGGGIRVVPEEGNIHETPLCPEFEGGKWSLWRDESALYHTLSDLNDAEYCPTCKPNRVTGLSEGGRA